MTDLGDIGRRSSAYVSANPGCTTTEIARALDLPEDSVYVALYRTGRHLGVGLTTSGWWAIEDSEELRERSVNAKVLPPCPPPTVDELTSEW